MSAILGIDIGYGHTKWASIGDSGDTKKGMFPSVAPITTRERTTETTGMSGLRTTTVAVNGRNYVVGRDAYLEADANYSRTRLEDYSQSEGYRALMLGALVLTGLREINQLVIGLPLTTLSTYSSQLQTQYAGEHLIGAIHAKRKTEIVVQNVNVTSQPAAAMVNAVTFNPALRKSTNMVIDLGYFTMDFLMCEGLRPYYPRSGAIQGGMSGYYDYLAALVSDKLSDNGLPAHDGVSHFRLEKALTGTRTDESGKPGYFLDVGNKSLDITDCVASASTKLEEYLDRMVTTLGKSSLGSIRAIVFAGGGAGLMMPIVRKRFGEVHDFVQLEEAQFAIAKGYSQIGLAASKRLATVA
jgi:plasmid segregation protein ParM